MLDQNITTLDPKGLARVMLVTSIFFLITTAITVILRCFVRLKYHNFGVDDGLMLAGWILNVIVTAVGIRAMYFGLGTKDKDLNQYLQVNGRKWMWIGQVFYSVSIIFIKCSICVTLLRITVVKIHRIIIWGTIIFTTVTMLYNTVGVFIICIPLTAIWDNRGKCFIPFLMSLAYTVSISAVISDWICSILPIFILYKSKMKRATKVLVIIILGLAVLASLCTIIRLPYLKAFSSPDDYLYNIGHVVLWSTFEVGIGIIAGSLPALHKLMSSNSHSNTSITHPPTSIRPFPWGRRTVLTSRSVSAARRAQRGDLSSSWEQLDNIECSTSQDIYMKVDLETQQLKRLGMSRE